MTAISAAVDRTPSVRTVTSRFLWKECRTLWPLAAGIVAIAAIKMAFLSRLPGAQGEQASWMLAGAWLATVVFAVAAPVVLFSGEREEGTDQWLLGLPSHPTGLALGKWLAVFTGAVVVLATLWLWGVAQTGASLSESNNYQAICQQGLCTALEAACWGGLASLLIPRPLAAAIVGVVGVAVGAQIVLLLFGRDGLASNLSAYQEVLPARLAICLCLGMVDVQLTRTWSRTTVWRTPGRRAGGVMPLAESRLRGWFVALDRRLSDGRRQYVRLLWQSWRFSWKRCLGVVMGGVVLMAAGEGALMQLLHAVLPISGSPAPLTLLLVPALLGSQTFFIDQQGGSLRFLGERPASPRRVWLARQSVTLAFALAVTFAACAALIALTISRSGDLHNWTINIATINAAHPVADLLVASDSQRAAQLATERVWGTLTYTLRWALCATFAAHGIGQLVSLAVRQSIAAAFVASAATCAATLWFYLVYAWRLEPVLYVASIALGAYAATFFQVGNWLRQRKRWTRGADLAIGVIAPVALILATAHFARWLQLRGAPLNANFAHEKCQRESSPLLAAGKRLFDAYLTLHDSDQWQHSIAAALPSKRFESAVDAFEMGAGFGGMEDNSSGEMMMASGTMTDSGTPVGEFSM
ncbi:MAG: hypothetical protein KDA61_17600, partial [Planctomycetales bacterium]|nr:hypothetical protein [Planctomycetales bacterium]